MLGLSSNLVMSGCVHGAGQEAEEKEQVIVFGPEVEHELKNLQDAFALFEEETDIEVVVTGSPNFEDRIDRRVADGNPPDIAIFPQPGKMHDLAEQIVPLTGDMVEAVEQHVDEWRTELVTTEDDRVLGVPVTADYKSYVWYSPQAFRENGYGIPQTLAGFEALAREMARDGKTPFCLGLESGFATGWPLTDWIEDYLLRLKGPEIYDAWVRHEIPFNHLDVTEVAQHVYEFLAQDGFVHEGIETASSRRSSDAALSIREGDCMMYRMANFQSRNWPVGTEVSADGDVYAFRLPGTEDHPDVALSGGAFATAFSDRRAVRETMEYLADPGYLARPGDSDEFVDFASRRAANKHGGFLSPYDHVDTDLYRTELDRDAHIRLASIQDPEDQIRFDATDLMPGAIGSDMVWKAMVEITTGNHTVEEAFTEIERNWDM